MKPPIITVVGYSNSGKTTLITRLIRDLTTRGFKIGAIKHAAHGFHMDRSGKDTWLHKQAGASMVAAASNNGYAVVKDVDEDPGPEVIAVRCMADADLVIVEGYKKLNLPKVETLGFGDCSEPLFDGDQNLVATVGGCPANGSATPNFSFDEIRKLADLVEQRFIKQGPA